MLIGGGDQGVEYVRARAGRFTLGAWRQRKSHLDQVNAQGIIGTRFQPSLSACQRGRAPDRADCVAEARSTRPRARVRPVRRTTRSVDIEKTAPTLKMARGTHGNCVLFRSSFGPEAERTRRTTPRLPAPPAASRALYLPGYFNV